MSGGGGGGGQTCLLCLCILPLSTLLLNCGQRCVCVMRGVAVNHDLFWKCGMIMNLFMKFTNYLSMLFCMPPGL